MLASRGRIRMDNINYETDSLRAALKMTYANSKLMNIVFGQEISRRWKHLGIAAFSCHPGFVRFSLFLFSLSQTSYYLLKIFQD